MKKAYLSRYTEIGFSTLVHINMDMHEGRLEPTSLNDDDIREIESNLLSDEHLTLEEKQIIVRGSTDLITIKKLYRRSNNSYIYLFQEHQNKLAIYKGITKLYTKEVQR